MGEPQGMEILHRLSFTIVAGNCVLCAGRAGRELDLCMACEADLPVLGPACLRCAIPLPHEGICPACDRAPPPFTHSWASFPYRSPIDRLIAEFKQRGQMTTGRALVDVAARRWIAGSPAFPDVLVPVPLHRLKQRERGFNQATYIARQFARHFVRHSARHARGQGFHIAVDEGLVSRTRQTIDQKSLTEAERRRNLAGAFRVSRIPPSHVAVIDDVVTTGATVREIAGALSRAGADRIDIIALARTPAPGQGAVW